MIEAVSIFLDIFAKIGYFENRVKDFSRQVGMGFQLKLMKNFLLSRIDEISLGVIGSRLRILEPTEINLLRDSGPSPIFLKCSRISKPTYIYRPFYNELVVRNTIL